MSAEYTKTVAAALALFRDDYNCAQAVVHAFREESGLDRDLALKAAIGFGGGMGRTQEVCGALAGAVFVLGLRHGRGWGESHDKTEATYTAVQALMDRFRAAHGTCLCRELLDGCDLQTKAGQEEYRRRGYRAARCEGFIREIVGYLSEAAGPL